MNQSPDKSKRDFIVSGTALAALKLIGCAHEPLTPPQVDPKKEALERLTVEDAMAQYRQVLGYIVEMEAPTPITLKLPKNIRTGQTCYLTRESGCFTYAVENLEEAKAKAVKMITKTLGIKSDELEKKYHMFVSVGSKYGRVYSAKLIYRERKKESEQAIKEALKNKAYQISTTSKYPKEYNYLSSLEEFSYILGIEPNEAKRYFIQSSDASGINHVMIFTRKN